MKFYPFIDDIIVYSDTVLLYRDLSKKISKQGTLLRFRPAFWALFKQNFSISAKFWSLSKSLNRLKIAENPLTLAANANFVFIFSHWY